MSFLHVSTLCKAGGACCPFAVAKMGRAKETAETFGVSARTIQRLKEKVRCGKLKCEKQSGCWLQRPLA